jgi:hypothetical protein
LSGKRSLTKPPETRSKVRSSRQGTGGEEAAAAALAVAATLLLPVPSLSTMDLRERVEEAYRRGVIGREERDKLLRLVERDPDAARAFLEYLEVLAELKKISARTTVEKRLHYRDLVEGEWIERRYSDGVVERYKYIGVFAPSEPFLAVFYNSGKDELETDPVYAFVVRVTLLGNVHYVEFLPVVSWAEEGLLVVVSKEYPINFNYVGVVPARLFEEVRGKLLKLGRELWGR